MRVGCYALSGSWHSQSKGQGERGQTPSPPPHPPPPQVPKVHSPQAPLPHPPRPPGLTTQSLRTIMVMIIWYWKYKGISTGGPTAGQQESRVTWRGPPHPIRVKDGRSQVCPAKHWDATSQAEAAGALGLEQGAGSRRHPLAPHPGITYLWAYVPFLSWARAVGRGVGVAQDGHSGPFSSDRSGGERDGHAGVRRGSRWGCGVPRHSLRKKYSCWWL